MTEKIMKFIDQKLELIVFTDYLIFWLCAKLSKWQYKNDDFWHNG